MHCSWSSCLDLIVHLQITNLTLQIFISSDFSSNADEKSDLENSPTKILLNNHALVIEDEDARSNHRDHEDTSKVRRRSSSLDDRFNGRLLCAYIVILINFIISLKSVISSIRITFFIIILNRIEWNESRQAGRRNMEKENRRNKA